MSLFGGIRDAGIIKGVSRELMQDIISQQVVYYKCNLEKTVTNMYGEASTGRVFYDPILLFALIERGDQTAPVDDFGVGFDWPITVRFLRDDLVDVGLEPSIGDFIMWQNAYWEIDNENINELFVGKDPDYPFNDSTGTNPLNPDLQNWGYNISVICTAHYVPADRVGIDKMRL